MKTPTDNARGRLRRGCGRLLLQALSGALVWAASPGLGEQFWLAAVALAPLFLSLHGTRGWRAAAWGGLGGMLYIVPGKWSTFATAIATMGVSALAQVAYVLIFFALFALPFALFAWAWQRLSAYHDAAAASWLGGFGLTALILHVPTVFPYTPAVMLTGSPVLIQLADVGGEPLLLGLLLTLNIGLAQLIAERRLCWSSGVAVLVPLAVTLSYGAYSLPHWQGPAQPSLSVLTLQGQWPWRSGDGLLLRDRIGSRPLSLVELTRAGLAASPNCDLVIWPESARVPTLPDRTCARGATLAAELGVPILATCHVPHEQAQSFAARLYTPDGLAGEHRKSRLVPMYETRWREDTFSLQPGGGMQLLSAPDLPPLAPAICYEAHFRHDLRRSVADGAQWIAHMANFAVFRHIEIHHWDLAMTRLRAVETRRSILRSVNAGIAGVVQPSGEWEPAAAAGESAARCMPVPVQSGLSVYARHGDRLFWMLLLGFGAALTGPLVRRRLLRGP
ncbi:MAG: nitrilase-related carbon-nitrogen hydrolase [Oceanococcaceae bacterium]